MDTSMYSLLLSLLCVYVSTTAAPTTTNNETLTLQSNTDTGDVTYRVSSVVKNCTLFASDKETVTIVNGHLTSGVNLLKYYLEFSNSEKVFKNDHSSLQYKPLTWVRTPGRLGNGLLMLRPEFNILSLGTLELGVISMHIQVEATPSGCLSHLNDIETEKVLRALVLNHFQNSSAEDIYDGRTVDQVCNIHITNESDKAKFRYFCCRKIGESHVHCEYLSSDFWLEILFAVMTFLKVLVVLFSPRLVPDSFYRIRNQAQTYRHKLIDDKRVVINLVKTTSQSRYKAKSVLARSAFTNMECFLQTLDGLQDDKPCRVILQNIRFNASRGRLLPANFAPVGLFRTFYEAFIKCRISERDALQECCNSDMLQKLPCGRSCTFLRFCKEIMKVVLVLLLAVPWILRALAYYEYEHDEVVMRKKAANNRGLDIEFPGSMTLFLTPLHVVFIVIYVVLSFEMCICGIAGTVGTRVSETLKFVTRKCFRDMREMNNTNIVGWAVKMSLKPCSSLGIFGIFIGLILWPVILPVILIVWAFYMIPTFNITFRLLGDLFFFLLTCVKMRKTTQNDYSAGHVRRIVPDKIYKRLDLEQLRAPESSSPEIKKAEQTISRHIQPLIIIFSLISLYSIIFLFVELVSFAVEIAVYTMMGLILNAGTIMTYLSLSLILGLYGNEVFGVVTNAFLAFNKKMNQIVLNLGLDKVEGVIYSKADKQNNVSFRVKTDKCKDVEYPVEFTVDPEGKPSWSVNRLLLFLDKQDQPFIPSRFYFKACTMDYYAAPGELLLRYISAGVEFGLILLFLIFVLLVVLAFGDSFALSSTNKLLATTLGGFVPLLLRKVVFKSHAVPDIDQSSVHFQVTLTDLIEPYQETWPIFDIDVVAVEDLVDNSDQLDLLITIP